MLIFSTYLQNSRFFYHFLLYLSKRSLFFFLWHIYVFNSLFLWQLNNFKLNTLFFFTYQNAKFLLKRCISSIKVCILWIFYLHLAYQNQKKFFIHGQLHYNPRHLFNIDVIFQSIFCSSRERIVPTFHILS